jgi:ribosomal protein S18 acetylase RimI-like enzyme
VWTDAVTTDLHRAGKERGYRLAEVSVFLGNDPAILAYKKKGFEEYQSIASPVWQRVIDCPGIMRLIKPLNDTSGESSRL